MSPQRQAAWSTRYGFYLVALASAFSLGNLWRFPFIVDANKGASFVLLYIICSLVIGLPLVIAEMILGKAYKQSFIGAMSELGRQSKFAQKTQVWIWIGRIANASSVLLLAYYAVVSGWVLYFLMQYLFGMFRTDFTGNHKIINNLISNGGLQVALTSVHILITGIAVSKRLKVGVEKSLGWLMPLFLGLIVFLVIRSLKLPGAIPAVRFLFYPNFSQIDSGTLTSVIGHVLFTLSIGMGTITAYGSYIREDSNLTAISFRMVILDIMTSLFVGLLIFPVVFTVEKFGDSGPSLMFHALPELFNKLGLSDIVGVAFFLCLYIAALASSIALLEASVSNLVDRHNYTRKKATQVMGLISFVVAILPALSSNMLEDLKIAGNSLLLFFDTLVVNWMLPIVAACISLAVGFAMKEDLKIKLFVDPNQFESKLIFSNWQFLIKWIVPVLIILGVATNIVGFLKRI